MNPQRHFHSFYRRAFYSFCGISFIMFLGTVGLHCLEKMSYLDAFYFMSMVATAQGPTQVPLTAAGKIFISLMAFISVGVGVTSLGFLFGPFFGQLWHIGILKLEDKHNESIIDQFTRQAVPFTQKIKSHANEEAFQLMFDVSGVTNQDDVLDVACGSGLVSCAFATKAKHVTGIDITPAMIEQAQKLQKQKGLKNLTWQIGNVIRLPYPSDSFSMVITRFSFHHFMDPLSVLKEMVRVCSPGGKIMIVDVAPKEDRVNAYNEFEKLRDPSHVRALTAQEMLALVRSCGLKEIKSASYVLEIELEEQLKASFPNPGDEDQIRKLFQKDLDKDPAGVSAQLKDGAIYLHYPVMITVGQKS